MNENSSQIMKGDIDELGIWNRTLSASEFRIYIMGEQDLLIQMCLVILLLLLI